MSPLNAISYIFIIIVIKIGVLKREIKIANFPFLKLANSVTIKTFIPINIYALEYFISESVAWLNISELSLKKNPTISFENN